MEPGEIFAALLTPDGRADPYPLYTALHEHGEVTGGDGFVLVPGYEAANAVLRDPGFLVSDAARYDAIMPDWRDHPSMSMNGILTLNAPQHGRIRRLISREFTQRRIAALEPAIGVMTDQMLDDMAESGADGSAVEFMHDFAFLLPVTVICELIGIPERDRESFRPIARALVATLEPTVTGQQIAEADTAALVAERRAAPRADLLSALAAVHDAGDGRLSDAELLDNLSLLLVAGFETTANLLGNGLRIVLADWRLADEIVTGGVPVPAFVEEVLRFDSPVQLTSRYVTAAASVGGRPVAAGEVIVVMLGAGNRDPRKFSEPGRFNPARSDGGPLSFGGGAHFCIGAALARLEAAVAFPRILRRFPDLAAGGEPVRKDGLILRGFESLPVQVGGGR
jgi:cytochrome P450